MAIEKSLNLLVFLKFRVQVQHLHYWSKKGLSARKLYNSNDSQPDWTSSSKFPDPVGSTKF